MDYEGLTGAKETKRDVIRVSPQAICHAACGLYHSLVVGNNQGAPQLLGWGRNHNNVLAAGGEVPEIISPRQIEHLTKIKISDVSCGLNHTVVISRHSVFGGGKVYSFGLGNRGRLGYTKYKDTPETAEADAWFTPKPIRVRFPNKDKIICISCGSDHTLALSTNGELFAWGVGQYGSLGTGHLEDVYSPQQIQFDDESSRVIHCAAGGKHSLACTETGQCYSWGHGGNGRLGQGHLKALLIPTLVQKIYSYDIIYVAAGEAHTACIDCQGILYTWGAGGYGRLGHGEDYDILDPRKVEELGGVRIVQVACGTFHTLAVTDSGSLYAWGAGLATGIMAESDTSAVTVPKLVSTEFVGDEICFVTTSSYHSIVINRTGDVFCWGVGGYYRLGHGDNVNRPFPQRIAELRGRAYLAQLQNLGARKGSQRETPSIQKRPGNESWRVKSVACGATHSMVLCANGDLWVWGSNQLGQLGLGKECAKAEEPVQLRDFRDPVLAIACGSNHSLATTFRGSLFTWGCGSQGQLGLGQIADAQTPTGIPQLQRVFQVYAGDDYSACLTAPLMPNQDTEMLTSEAGSLWTWGSCETGKLGLEGLTSGSSVTPKKVPLPVALSKVACGRSHMVVCSSKGEVFAWGAGYFGRLGNNSASNSSTPILVLFPESVRICNVAAGAFHSLALDTNGFIWLWGRDVDVCSPEHLRVPKRFDKYIPLNSYPLFKDIYAAGSHSFGITRYGELMAWGDNSEFKLGISIKDQGTITQPVFVDNLDDKVEQFGTSETHSIVCLQHGLTYAWGSTQGSCLGVGHRREAFVTTPQLVKAHWTEVSALPRSQATDAPSMERTKTTQESFQDEVHTFLERLKHSFKSFSFAFVQNMLKKEPPENRYTALKAAEDDLIKILGKYVDTIIELPESEFQIKALEFTLQRQMTSIVVNTPCESYYKKHPSMSSVAPRFYISKLWQIHQFIYYLQMQPAYLVYLNSAIQDQQDRQTLLQAIRQIFYQLDDDHLSATFLGLVAALAVSEAEQIPDLEFLYSFQSGSIVADLAYMYGSSSKHVQDLGNSLLNPHHAGGVVELLAQTTTADSGKGNDATKATSMSMMEFISNETLQNLSKRSMEHLANIMNAIAQSLVLPIGIVAILRQIYEYLITQDWTSETTPASPSLTSKILYPLVRIVLQGLVRNFYLYSSRLVGLLPMASPQPERGREKAYQLICDFIDAGFETDYADCESAHLLRFVFNSACEKIAELIYASIAQSPQGYISVQATLGFYLTHFTAGTHVVTMESSNVAKLVNLFETHEAKVALSLDDPVISTLKSMIQNSGPVFSSEEIAELEAKPYYHNIPIDRRFFPVARNAVIDPLTFAIVPQRLAYRQQAAYQEGKTVIALVARFVASDILDPRFILEKALQSFPDIKGLSWADLRAELQELQESFARQRPPDFDKAQLAVKAAQIASQLDKQEASVEKYFKWLGEGLRLRQRHQTYLALLQMNEGQINLWERKYRQYLDEQIVSLQETISSMRQLNVEPPLLTRLSAARMTPTISSMLTNLQSLDLQPTTTAFTFPLQFLVDTRVVAKTVLDLDMVKRTLVEFILHQDGSYGVEILESAQSTVHVVDSFTLSLEEIQHYSQLPHVLIRRHGRGCLEFQNGPLSELLTRAAVEPVRIPK